MRRLQSALNAAARLIFHLRRSDHITDALVSLHWLRVPERIQFKIAVLTYRVLHSNALWYLGPLTSTVDVPGRRALRSAGTNHLVVPPAQSDWLPSAAELFRLPLPTPGTLFLNTQVTLLALLDSVMSAAFDCVDNDLLLQRLQPSFGITGTSLGWTRSFLSDRTYQRAYGGELSATHLLQCGLSQGSVLGPLLYILYTVDICHVVERHNLCLHLYAEYCGLL